MECLHYDACGTGHDRLNHLYLVRHYADMPFLLFEPTKLSTGHDTSHDTNVHSLLYFGTGQNSIDILDMMQYVGLLRQDLQMGCTTESINST